MISDQTQNQSPEPNVTTTSEPVPSPYLAYVGINEAARIAGKGKAQIYRDIQAGKLSWHIEEDGKKTLQIADLGRIYNLIPKGDTGNKTTHENRVLPLEKPSVTTEIPLETAVEIAVLRAELKAKDEMIQRIENEVQDLRQNRDRQQDTIQRLTLLLPAPAKPDAPTETVAQPQAPTTESNKGEQSVSWFRKLFK